MILLDLDNCISNDAHRIPRIAWQHSDPERRYFDYHSLAPWDVRGNEELFIGRDDIAIFTARPVAFAVATQEWLARNGVQWRHLLMRNAGDHRRSIDLKRAQLHWLVAHYAVQLGEIECAYDDRADVVEMYRAEGLRAEQRWIHTVCAYTPRQVPAEESV